MVLVSGAVGAVGSVAGQIAKTKGAHVIGIAGGPEKCRMLVDRLGFSAAIDYKRDDFLDQLRDHTPRYVDVSFDNVGGDILNQGITRLTRGARVVISGAISQYDNADAVMARPPPQLEGIGGRYFEDCNEAETLTPEAVGTSSGGAAPYALDPDAAERLWALSLAAVGA
ncbi:zinc-binding dehydrogenase [Streptomyces sp. NBC_00268]|uniref:zinc-binding dehydrogenase n=1 Tax=Streptomyces sp. NBC_00268 TaxID=2975695 RepID=UPI002B1DEDEA|nr:zinc-binding dehydrogenase [Streptomyces sp. NBC_00268]